MQLPSGTWGLRPPTSSVPSSARRSRSQVVPSKFSIARPDRGLSTLSESPGKNKPLLLFLPAVEGLAISIKGQLSDLCETFDVHLLTASAEDRSSYADLLAAAVDFIASAPSPVILVGESFGGMLSLGVAQSPRTHDNLAAVFAINPATCVAQPGQQWLLRAGRLLSSAPPVAYESLGATAFLGLIPDLGQVHQVLQELLSSPSSFTQGTGREIVTELVGMSSALPSATLKWRLSNWLAAAEPVVNAGLEKIRAPVTVLAGTADRLLPSVQEARRIQNILGADQCRVVEMIGHGHAPLFDSRLSLRDIVLDSPEVSHLVDNEAVQEKVKRQSAAKSKTVNPLVEMYGERDWVADYLPPSASDIADAQRRMSAIKKYWGPVFFSTLPDGKITGGLGPLDSSQGRPLCFIGNHQLLAADTWLLVSQIQAESGIIVRGLSHPANMLGKSLPGPLGAEVRKAFLQFGAVPTSSRNMFRLLSSGQSTLLYPGGAREVYHLKGEEYQLFWPSKQDWTRICVKTNAIIVPVAAIGVADSIQILLDSEEVLSLPFVGDELRRQSDEMPDARRRSAGIEAPREQFVSPVGLPKPPERLYFLLGRPFDTKEINASDREACEQLYQEVREEMFSSINLLLEAREKDTYRKAGPRWLYEGIIGEEAPTISRSVLNRLKNYK